MCRLTFPERMEIYTRLASMVIPTMAPILTRMGSLDRLRSLIRFQGLCVFPPNPNHRQIILTRLDRLTRMTRLPRLDRGTSVPRHTRMPRMQSITTTTWPTILQRLNRTARLTRMDMLSCLTILIRRTFLRRLTWLTRTARRTSD